MKRQRDLLPLYQRNPKDIKQHQVKMQHISCKTYYTVPQSQPFLELNHIATLNFFYENA